MSQNWLTRPRREYLPLAERRHNGCSAKGEDGKHELRSKILCSRSPELYLRLGSRRQPGGSEYSHRPAIVAVLEGSRGRNRPEGDSQSGGCPQVQLSAQ